MYKKDISPEKNIEVWPTYRQANMRIRDLDKDNEVM